MLARNSLYGRIKILPLIVGANIYSPQQMPKHLLPITTIETKTLTSSLMKYINTLLFTALLSIGMQSCDKAPQVPPIVILPDSLHEGIYVLNEGNFQSGNATLDFIDVFNNVYYSDVYKRSNNKALGDVLQSMSVINDKLYLVINNSGKIEVLDKSNFKSISTISGLRSPRYIKAVSSNKAYISDLYENAVTVIDLSNNSVLKKITFSSWTENMLLSGNNMLLTCPNNNFIYSIDIFTDQIKDSIQLSYGTHSILQENDSTFWVMCDGNQTKKINAALHKLNYRNNTFILIKSYTFDLGDKPRKLVFNKSKSNLYWLNNDIYKMSVTDSILPKNPFVNADGKNFYGLCLDNKYNELYVSDVLDYVQKSKCYRYNANTGQLSGLFSTGIITGDFYFNY